MRKGFTTLDFLDIFLIDTRPPIVTLDENTERVSGHNVTLKWTSNEYAIFKCAVDLVETVKSNYQILMMDHIPFGLKLMMSWVILPRGKNTLGMLVSYHVKMLNSLHPVL